MTDQRTTAELAAVLADAHTILSDAATRQPVYGVAAAAMLSAIASAGVRSHDQLGAVALRLLVPNEGSR